MTNNNYQNDLPCAFAETLVAVLYGEATAFERQEFRKHFNSCQSCREELTSFGSIREAVSEWRAADFEPFQNHRVVLPEIEKKSARQSAKTTWSERLRQFLFPNSGQFRGATALAAFAVTAFLLAIFGYALINRFSNREVKVADVPTIEQTQTALNNPSPTPVEQISETAAQANAQQPKKNSSRDVKSTNKPGLSIVKNPARPDKLLASPPSPLPLHQPTKPVNERNTIVAPPPKAAELAIESVDDLEDNSLRLTDLLDDMAPSM